MTLFEVRVNLAGFSVGRCKIINKKSQNIIDKQITALVDSKDIPSSLFQGTGNYLFTLGICIDKMFLKPSIIYLYLFILIFRSLKNKSFSRHELFRNFQKSQ